jgi:hypothetical protein
VDGADPGSFAAVVAKRKTERHIHDHRRQYPYGADSQFAYWRGIKIEGADVKSFKNLDHKFASSGAKIFWEGNWLKEADSTSFVADFLNVGHDDKNYFVEGKVTSRERSRSYPNYLVIGDDVYWGSKKIDGVHGPTFEELTPADYQSRSLSPFGYDRAQLVLKKQLIPRKPGAKIRRLETSNIQACNNIKSLCYTDGSQIYFFEKRDKILQLGMVKLKVTGEKDSYLFDGSKAYFLPRDRAFIETIDEDGRQMSVLSDSNWAHAGKKVFYRGKPVFEAELEELKVCTPMVLEGRSKHYEPKIKFGEDIFEMGYRAARKVTSNPCLDPVRTLKMPALKPEPVLVE